MNAAMNSDDEVEPVGNLSVWRVRFQNGKNRAIPPMFFEECARDLESAGCGRAENKCVEPIERKGVE
jgi:hypothetical protein